MTHISVDVPPLAHVDPHAGSEPVGRTLFNRRALRAGKAIASAILGALSLAPATAFVALPIDGAPVPASTPPQPPPSLRGRIRRILQPRWPPDGPPGQAGMRPPRLMPTEAGRYVNAMPSHAMAAGGRPLMMKIPGK